ncbi:hypothetical protein FRC10_003492 [Ceratobasidium sp. 414]|nr:hypothetical protein FRC10_003492 [Ceratobasidium sp. 414]
MTLGKRAAAMMDLLEALDEEWEAEVLNLVDNGAMSDSDDEYDILQAELHHMRDCMNWQHELGENENEQVNSMHEKILRSMDEDDRLSFIHGLGDEPSMDDLEHARALLFALVMEPDVDEEPVEDNTGVRKRAKTHKVRQPYTITCALKKTNWFERSFKWENDQFRAFYRLGAGARYPMMLTGIGEGTVLLYCRRVIRAIREFGPSCIGWPSAERKAVIKAGFKGKCGLDDVIGALDGSLLKLANKPQVEGDSYISRKGTASVTVQVITDHEGRIISYQCGLPGSKNDMYVWKNSVVHQKRHKLFEPGEFLLADGGYPLSRFVLIPFSRPERRIDGDRKRTFNRRISKARVIIECTFGRLKARFPSLHRLGAVEDMKDLYRSIEAMLILHNMCYDLHDRPDGFVDSFTQLRIENGETVYDYVAQESSSSDDDDEGGLVEEEDVLNEGRRLRNRYLDTLCPV